MDRRRLLVILAVIVALLVACTSGRAPGPLLSPLSTAQAPILSPFVSPLLPSPVEDLPFRTLAKYLSIGMVERPTLDQLLDNGDFLILNKSEDFLNPEPDHPEVRLIFGSRTPGELIPPELRTVDYSREFAVIVFHRSGGISEYNTVDVREITRAGNQVVLQAHFGSIPPDIPSLPAISYPNQVGAVSKEGKWGQDIHFVLQVDGKVVKERTYFVP
jgi:hypothetical protein